MIHARPSAVPARAPAGAWPPSSAPNPEFERAPSRAAAPAAPETKRAQQPLTKFAADGTFSGYASIFGVPDLSGDVVVKGAFRRSLLTRDMTAIKMLFQHDPAQPIGVWTTLLQNDRGLFVAGRLLPEIARAREVLALMRAGALDGLSIGFRTVKGSRDPTTGLRRLEEIDLWEISIVTFPMQPDARVSTVKSKPPTPTADRALLTRLRRATRDLSTASSASPSVH